MLFLNVADLLHQKIHLVVAECKRTEFTRTGFNLNLYPSLIGVTLVILVVVKQSVFWSEIGMEEILQLLRHLQTPVLFVLHGNCCNAGTYKLAHYPHNRHRRRQEPESN